MITALVVLGCIVSGVVGAFASIRSHHGKTILYPLMSGVVATLVWAGITKAPINPWKAAVMWDSICGLSWLVTLYILGERPTVYGILGAGMVLVGLGIANLE